MGNHDGRLAKFRERAQYVGNVVSKGCGAKRLSPFAHSVAANTDCCSVMAMFGHDP